MRLREAVECVRRYEEKETTTRDKVEEENSMMEQRLHEAIERVRRYEEQETTTRHKDDAAILERKTKEIESKRDFLAYERMTLLKRWAEE